jgi:hypothetical protein
MKKFIIILSVALIAATGCSKNDLNLINPNSPTPQSALPTQTGIEALTLGIWSKVGTSGNNWLTYASVAHSIMGDEQWASVGNFGWRYTDQVNTITLPAPYNTVVPNIFGVTQQVQLQSLNTLVSTNLNSNNIFVYEWNLGYLVNGEANNLLQALTTNTAISATEQTVLQAVAYWWKGFAYSRLGSMYLSGVINNAIDGTTSNTYVPHAALITEANADFNKAIALLQTLPAPAAGDTYSTVMKIVNPNFTLYPTNRDMFIREIYTYLARNYMVNLKVAAATATDWQAIQTLATKGMVQGDVGYSLGMDPSGTDLSGSQQHVFEWGDYPSMPGWTYMSERLAQDFKPGDSRFTKGVITLTTAKTVVNNTSRGIQFGTRYVAQLIEAGGYWATFNHSGYQSFGCSWEENALMLAETNIRTGSIETGLGYVDQVRTGQGAALPAVKGTGLNLANALEELRKERRIGLYLRGVAFYDARRWGVTAPASSGGGRANCNVVVPNNLLGNASATGFTVLACFMDYNYMDYWDVPATEFSYNVPSAGSAAIAN